MKAKPVGSCQNERGAAPAATPLSPFRPLDRAQAHATGRAQCRQKRRERGYYHLHRQLNHPLLLHHFTPNFFFWHTDLTDLTDFLCASAAFMLHNLWNLWNLCDVKILSP